MICKLLEIIELLDELQYWIDNWTHCNPKKRYANFDRIADRLWELRDMDSARVADMARRKSVFLPFSEVVGPSVYDPAALSDLVVEP